MFLLPKLQDAQKYKGFLCWDILWIPVIVLFPIRVRDLIWNLGTAATALSSINTGLSSFYQSHPLSYALSIWGILHPILSDFFYNSFYSQWFIQLGLLTAMMPLLQETTSLFLLIKRKNGWRPSFWIVILEIFFHSHLATAYPAGRAPKEKSAPLTATRE